MMNDDTERSVGIESDDEMVEYDLLQLCDWVWQNFSRKETKPNSTQRKWLRGELQILFNDKGNNSVGAVELLQLCCIVDRKFSLSDELTETALADVRNKLLLRLNRAFQYQIGDSSVTGNFQSWFVNKCFDIPSFKTRGISPTVRKKPKQNSTFEIESKSTTVTSMGKEPADLRSDVIVYNSTPSSSNSEYPPPSSYMNSNEQMLSSTAQLAHKYHQAKAIQRRKQEMKKKKEETQSEERKQKDLYTQYVEKTDTEKNKNFKNYTKAESFRLSIMAKFNSLDIKKRGKLQISELTQLVDFTMQTFFSGRNPPTVKERGESQSSVILQCHQANAETPGEMTFQEFWLWFLFASDQIIRQRRKQRPVVSHQSPSSRSRKHDNIIIQNNSEEYVMGTVKESNFDNTDTLYTKANTLHNLKQSLHIEAMKRKKIIAWAEKAFSRLDSQKRGSLGVPRIIRLAEMVWNLYCSDNTDSVSSTKLSQEYYETLMDRIGESRDSRISFSEFIKWFENTCKHSLGQDPKSLGNPSNSSIALRGKSLAEKGVANNEEKAQIPKLSISSNLNSNWEDVLHRVAKEFAQLDKKSNGRFSPTDLLYLVGCMLDGLEFDGMCTSDEDRLVLRNKLIERLDTKLGYQGMTPSEFLRWFADTYHPPYDNINNSSSLDKKPTIQKEMVESKSSKFHKEGEEPPQIRKLEILSTPQPQFPANVALQKKDDTLSSPLPKLQRKSEKVDENLTFFGYSLMTRGKLPGSKSTRQKYIQASKNTPNSPCDKLSLGKDKLPIMPPLLAAVRLLNDNE